MAAAKRYPEELKVRAVGMVCELGPGRGAIARVARQLGLNPETLRHWVRQEGNVGRPSGAHVVESESDKDARIAAMEREMRELRRANEILRLAAAFFAKEVDLQPPR
jgi:transposase